MRGALTGSRILLAYALKLKLRKLNTDVTPVKNLSMTVCNLTAVKLKSKS